MEFVRSSFQSFFEDVTITPVFLKTNICNTLYLEFIVQFQMGFYGHFLFILQQEVIPIGKT